MVNLTNKDLLYALGLCGIFVSAYLFTSVVYHHFLGPLEERRHLRRRLLEERRDTMIKAQIFKTPESAKQGLIVNFLEKIGYRGWIEKLQKELLKAGIYQSSGNFLSKAVILASAGIILGQLRQSYLISLALAIVLGLVPFLMVSIKKKTRNTMIERQMPDVMELLARSLRAGHTLPSAMELASNETPHPLGTELRLAYEEQRLGISLADALKHMIARVDCRDLQYFVTAVLIQTETGGNLAEIMEKIGFLIRDRLRVKGKIRGLTAEGKLSACILGGLPFAMFLILYVIHKTYVMTLFVDPAGQKLLVAGIVSLTLGILSMKRIIQRVKL
jgi:tight adherence protein B